MSEQDFEFLLSQYVDGTLSADQRADIERRLQMDAHARAMLAELQKLDQLLRGSETAPELRWDRVAQSICDSLHEEAAEKDARPIWIHRIGWTALAAAAAILIGIDFYPRGAGPASPVATPNDDVALVAPAPAPTTAESEVSDVGVGAPPPALAANYAGADSVLVHRPVVYLAGFSPKSAMQVQ